MAVLRTLAGQIFDKLADTLVSPVLGYVTAASSSGTVILPQGTTGTLPDGRVIRVRKGMRVPTGGALVPVRLLGLAPTFPKAGNFAAVASGLTVTWASPPTGIVATGTTYATFTAGAFPTVSAVVENDFLGDDARGFAAAAVGNTFLVLHEPEGNWRQRMGGGHQFRRQFDELIYRLELRTTLGSNNNDRRFAAQAAKGAIIASLGGATVGSGPVEIRQMRQLSRTPAESRWEIRFVVVALINGRAQSFAAAGQDPRTGLAMPKLTDVNGSIVVSAGSQPTPFTVTPDITLP